MNKLRFLVATWPVQILQLVRDGASPKNPDGLTPGLAQAQVAVLKATKQSTPCRMPGGTMAHLDSVFLCWPWRSQLLILSLSSISYKAEVIICRVIPAVIIVKPRILKFQTGGDLRDNPIWPLFHAQRNSATCQVVQLEGARAGIWCLTAECVAVWGRLVSSSSQEGLCCLPPAPSLPYFSVPCHSLCTRHFPCDTAPSSRPLPAARPSWEREQGRAVASGLAFRELWALVYLWYWCGVWILQIPSSSWFPESKMTMVLYIQN